MENLFTSGKRLKNYVDSYSFFHFVNETVEETVLSGENGLLLELELSERRPSVDKHEPAGIETLSAALLSPVHHENEKQEAVKSGFFFFIRKV